MLILLLAACTTGLAPDFGDRLSRTGGCGDVVFFGADAADTTLLSVRANGLVSEAHAAGEERSWTFDLPDPRVVAVVEVGRNISDAICDDVIENGGPRVDQVYTATSGTAEITVRPGETEWDARGDLRLEGVTFDSDGESATLDAFELLDVAVGWLAG